ncbi:hypothetical protein [Streptomyces sp. NPDC096323]|uniref:hypothetical protein n=1 Tax=Streptomyces sp. NPDC096323 TaxID=3155822 RepID=UPI00331EC22A
MAFPEDAIGLRAELLLGGAWTDITPDLYTRDPVRITHGAASEGTTADPASCSLLLNNTGGKYSPRNALGPFYGLLGRNTPVRVTVPGNETYLALDGTTAGAAATPDVAALDIVGDLDIRAEVTADWRAPGVQTLVGKWVSATNQRSYMLRLENGLLTLNWSPDGASIYFVSQLLPTLPLRAALRATLDVDNGAGGMTAVLYWAESLAGPWTALGPPLVFAGVVSVYAGTAPLEIAPVAATGWGPLHGRAHRAEVRSGIGGAVVAAPDFRALAPGTTSVTDSAGRVWSVTGTAELSDREGLFAGEVSEWPPRWEPGGHSAWVPVEAAGILRRLGQGRRPLQSTLRRRIPSDPTLLAYWPMEDGELATQIYSPIDGVQPLKWSGLDLAADSSLAGSAPLPTLGDVATFSGTVPPAPVQGWQVELVYRLPTMPTISTEILRVTVAGSVMRTAHVYAGGGAVRIEARNAEGEVVAFFQFSDATALSDFTGAWNRLTVYVSDAGGGQTRVAACWRDIANGAWWKASTVYTGAMGTATGVRGDYGSATSGMSLGHLAVFALAGTQAAPGANIFAGADRAFLGESALDRLVRLSVEEPALRLVTVDGDTTVGAARMGPQGQDELMTLVSEVADTDRGILYERMDRLGLVYRDRTSLYNQTPALVLDYAAGQVAPPLEPTDDDATLRNDVTVSRDGGSSGRAVLETGPLSILPPEQGGVGTYEESVTLSLADDNQTQPIAGWLMHLGTWDEARYPSVRVLLHRRPELIPAVLALRPGDLLRIINPPMFTGPGPLDLLIRQIDHQPLPRTWEVTFSCVPAGPYRVGVANDPARARADTAGSELAAAVSETATAWPVVTTAGRPWVSTADYPAEFPFDVIAGGEVATVTGITGVAEDRFGRTVLGGWGTADSGQAWTVADGPAGDWSVSGGTGRCAISTANAFRIMAAAVTTPDVDLRFDFALSALPVGDSAYVFPTIRYLDGTHMYMGRVQITAAGAMLFSLRRRSGAESQLGSAYTTGFTYVPGVWYTVRVAMAGSTLTGKIWPRGSAEPAWQATVVDTALTAPGSVAVRALLGASVSNAPLTIQFDTLYAGPQQMAVTRAVNGISKSQLAGADLRLAHPTIAAL